MENLKALGRGTQIMFIAAVLLLIDSFFHWQEVSFNLGPLGTGSAGQNALHGFFGWMMFLLTIVLVARIAARLAAVEVPIPLSFATTSFVLGILIAICAVLKLISDDYRTFWAFIGVGLAIVVAVGAWLEVQEAGGVEHLKSEASSLGSTGATTAAAPAAAAAGPAEAVPSTMGDAADSATSAVGDTAATATSAAGDAANTVESAAGDTTDAAKSALGDAEDAAADTDMPSTERGT